MSLRNAVPLCFLGFVAVGCVDDAAPMEEDIAGDSIAQSSIVAEEADWELTDSFVQNGAIAAKFSPVNDAIYFGGRTGTSIRRGLWRFLPGTIPRRIGGSFQVGGVAVDPQTGDVFLGTDFEGVIFRSVQGGTLPTSWVSGFADGDDDPVGMDAAPLSYTGSLVAPGEIVVVDRGADGLDQIWAFTPSVQESERLIHPDDGTLVDGVDVAVTDTDIYVADQGANQIYRLLDDGTLEAIPMPADIRPSSLAVDPFTQNLFVMDINAGTVVRLDPETGDSSIAFSGLEVTTDNFGCLDVSPDGLRIVITERGASTLGTVSIFGLPGPPDPDPEPENQAPVAVCEDIIVELPDNECVAPVELGVNSFDPDGDNITIALSQLSPYPLGESQVTVTVTDPSGATDSCVSTVVVESQITEFVATNAVSDPTVHGGNSDHGLVVWGFFGGGTTIFDFEDVTFELAEDGSTARMTGTMRVRDDGVDGSRNGDEWGVDLELVRAPDITQPKLELSDPDVTQPPSVTDEWFLFTLADGSFVFDTDTSEFAELHHRPADLRFGFQVGFTANGKNLNFGMSGWLAYDYFDCGCRVRSGKGDFNVDLTSVCD